MELIRFSPFARQLVKLALFYTYMKLGHFAIKIYEVIVKITKNLTTNIYEVLCS